MATKITRASPSMLNRTHLTFCFFLPSLQRDPFIRKNSWIPGEQITEIWREANMGQIKRANAICANHKPLTSTWSKKKRQASKKCNWFSLLNKQAKNFSSQILQHHLTYGEWLLIPDTNRAIFPCLSGQITSSLLGSSLKRRPMMLFPASCWRRCM